MLRRCLLALTFALYGCGFSTGGAGEFTFGDDALTIDDAQTTTTTGATDGDTLWSTDAPAIDSSRTDSGVLDTTTIDSGSPETSLDTSTPDTTLDTGAVDSGATETSPADAPVDVPVPPPCSDGTLFRGHCYFTYGSDVWVTGHDSCRARSAHVVEIDDDAENFFVFNLERGQEHWIDLTAPHTSTDRADFHWQDGDPATYRNWASTDPNGDGPCVVLRDSDGQWVDRSCSDHYRAICERE